MTDKLIANALSTEEKKEFGELTRRILELKKAKEAKKAKKS